MSNFVVFEMKDTDNRIAIEGAASIRGHRIDVAFLFHRSMVALDFEGLQKLISQLQNFEKNIKDEYCKIHEFSQNNSPQTH